MVFFLTVLALLTPIRLGATQSVFTPPAAETATIALLGGALFCASIFLRKRRAILTPPLEARIIEPVSSQPNPANAAPANHSPQCKKQQPSTSTPPPPQ